MAGDADMAKANAPMAQAEFLMGFFIKAFLLMYIVIDIYVALISITILLASWKVQQQNSKS